MHDEYFGHIYIKAIYIRVHVTFKIYIKPNSRLKTRWTLTCEKRLNACAVANLKGTGEHTHQQSFADRTLRGESELIHIHAVSPDSLLFTHPMVGHEEPYRVSNLIRSFTALTPYDDPRCLFLFFLTRVGSLNRSFAFLTHHGKPLRSLSDLAASPNPSLFSHTMVSLEEPILYGSLTRGFAVLIDYDETRGVYPSWQTHHGEPRGVYPSW